MFHFGQKNMNNQVPFFAFWATIRGWIKIDQGYTLGAEKKTFKILFFPKPLTHLKKKEIKKTLKALEHKNIRINKKKVARKTFHG